MKSKQTQEQKDASWGATLVIGNYQHLTDCDLKSLLYILQDELKRREVNQ